MKTTTAIPTVICILCCVFATAQLFGQTAGRTTQRNAGANNANQPAALPEGYGKLAWNVNVTQARDQVEGKLYFTDDKQIIISKDGELEYYYGFFYVDPTQIPAEENAGNANDNTANIDEGKLFYVSLKFPYLSMETVKAKLNEKYGEESFSDMKNNRGAIAWESEKTIVIMWIDEYEKRPFCRKINYLSRETIKELNDYVYKVFNKTELEVIKKLNP